MKVLHVTPALPPNSGPAEVAIGICKGLAAKGLYVSLFTTNFGREGEVPSDATVCEGGVEIHYSSYTPVLSWYLYSKALRSMLLRKIREFDIVHIHGIWLYPTAVAAASSRRYSVPYLIRPRGNLNRYALSQKWLKKMIYAWLVERKNLNRASAVQFSSQLEAEEAAAFGISTPSVIVPNGIEEIEDSQIACLKGSFRGKYPQLSGKTIILFLGRINPIKGLDRLTRAFAMLVRKHPNCRLVLAGPDNGGFSATVASWLKKLGVNEFAVFTGNLTGDEKLAALIDSDIFCLPSYQEAHSIAMTEAMGCGLPVVITRSVNFPEVEQAGAGIEIKGADDELMLAFTKLVADPMVRIKMGRNARRLVQQKYIWSNVASTQIRIYESILSGNLGDPHQA